MAARLACTFFLLEEAKREDNKTKRREGYQIRELRLLSTDKDYVRIFRLTEELVSMLERDLTPFLPIARRRGGLSNRTKILCTLGFLATGSYQKYLGTNVNTHISQPSTSRAIRAVVHALSHPHIVRKYISFPQNYNERLTLKERFFNKFKVPGVIGCIDGSLVAMIRPKEHEERYYCRKGYHARNVLMITDCDLNIIHVDVKFGGATHDSFIFNNSIVKRHLEQLNCEGETVYLLGDSGFAQRPYMMTPYTNPVAGSRQEFYNKLHGSARNSIERAFGILKGRFRCLLVHRVLHFDPEMVAKIIIACCVLHNICNRAGLPAPSLPNNIIREENQIMGMLQRNPRQSRADDLEEGRRCRELLANRLWRARQSE